MNRLNTKRAALISLLALVLCFTMLVGTTFAWFTDSVTSTGNIIKTGTLEVTMDYSKTIATPNWQDASQGAIFDYSYWEPGYTELRYVKVTNVGDLALRYTLNILPDTAPVQGEANLADVIDVYFAEVDPATATDLTRAQLNALIEAGTIVKAGTLSSLIADADGAARGVILPSTGSTDVTLDPADAELAREGEVTIALVLKMQETAGNEYQNISVGGAFTVQLLATQYNYENDSFNNEYDADLTP